jgi:hypothetical protein
MFRLRTDKTERKVTKDKKTGAVRSFFGAEFVNNPSISSVSAPPVDKIDEKKTPIGIKAVEIADRFLRVNAPKFKLKGLKLKKLLPEEGKFCESVTYEQKIAGVPIYGGRIVIGLRKQDGAVISTINNLDYEVPSTLKTKTRKTAAQIKEVILRHNFGFVKLGEPKLYIYRHYLPTVFAPAYFQTVRKEMVATTTSKIGKVYLAWQIFMDTREPNGSWEVLIDDATNEIITVKDRQFYDTPKGKVFWPDPIRSKKDNNLNWKTDSKTLNSQRKEVKIENLDNPVNQKYSLSGCWVKNVDAEDPKFKPPTTKKNFVYGAKTRKFRNVMAYYYLDKLVSDLTSLGVPSFNEAVKKAGPISADPQGCWGQDNSYFKFDLNGMPYLSFGEDVLPGSNTPTSVPDATDAAIIVHEYGHAIHYFLLGHHDNSPFEEGFNDFLAACWLDRYNDNQYRREEVMLWDQSDSVEKNPNRRVNLFSNQNCDFTFSNKRFEDQCLSGNDYYLLGDLHASALWDIFLSFGGSSADSKVRKDAADKIITLYFDTLIQVKANTPLKNLVDCLSQLHSDRGGQKNIIQNPYDQRGSWNSV